MGRIFGILLIGLGIWVGLEIYLEGTQGAFGGALAFLESERETPRDARTTPQRAGDAVRQAQQQGMQRREQLMPE
jgi:hypothetical protein